MKSNTVRKRIEKLAKIGLIKFHDGIVELDVRGIDVVLRRRR